MTGNSEANGPETSRRQISRRGLLGMGLGLASAGCLRFDAETETATETGKTPTTAESSPELQSAPTGLTEAWSREDESLALRASPSSNAVFVGGRNSVSRIDAGDGSRRWDQETGLIGTRPTVTDSTVYASGRDGTFYALDRDDGSTNWTFEADIGLTTVPLAVPDQNRIVVGAGETSGTVVGADGADTDSEHDSAYVYGLDTDGNEVWTVETANGDPVTGTAVHDGVVYVRTANRMDTYNLSDGTERDAGFGVHDVQWDVQHPMNGTYYSNRVAADETGVYLLTQDYVASVIHDGTHRWTYEPFDQSLRFQYEPGTVYISAADNALYAVDAAEGSQQWRVQVDGTPKALLLADGYLWSGDTSNTITAVDTDSGTVAFKESVGEPFNAESADLAVAGQHLVYSIKGEVRGFEIVTEAA
ncbi:PQQ-like beta-propeller repeat protein [Haloarcula laminariae]|uniref:PQQ-like beta-propeller repeat protein n=1 Tax=Haloarcula laminariae TaxID=2961577 RepID=UPI0021C69D07|nr:PQQ-like beta-propeller repeat protein [Halomicroarcula laminariae]